jgi:exopolyphosphatase / guanosine-5'-triphosphate,3'-diphosphate pyrophosphatase
VFVQGVKDRLGVVPDVVSGDEEAELSFAGATADLAGSEWPAPYLVCDIGGGSTEFVLGDAGGVRVSLSVDIGCVRMTERHLHDDPPAPAQVAAATVDVDAAIDRANDVVGFAAARTLVGLAGSVTTVVALALGLDGYDPQRIHHARISAEQVHDVTLRLLGATREQRAALSVMHPGRVDVIAAGALVLDRVVTTAGFDSVVASEHDILDGIALSVADRQ